jgi:hypothetical protein
MVPFLHHSHPAGTGPGRSLRPTSLSPNPWRWSGGGILLGVSILLHGLILALPTAPTPVPPAEPVLLEPFSHSPEASSPPENPIQVVRLPGQSSPAGTPSGRSSPVATPVPPPPPRRPQPTVASPPVTISPPPALPLDTPVPIPAPERASDADVVPASEPASEPVPTPLGLIYNNQVQPLTTDTRDFLIWYNEQDWSDFDLVPLPNTKELAVLEVPYPGEVCLTRPAAPGRLEVIITSGGQLYRAPRLLATTGYDDLDAAALACAAEQSYTEAANPNLPNPTVYWLPITVQYQGPTDCPPNPGSTPP